MAVWYCGSADWTAVTAWAAGTAYNVGDLRRQLAAPAAGSERVFRCTTAGLSGGAEPAWTLTKGSTTNDNLAVWTEVTGNSTYGWTAAHARVRNALPWIAAGDAVYVADNHAATEAAAITLTSPGTAAAPCWILCCDNAATPPTTLTTTATETTTGASNIQFDGFAYYYGITFSAGSAASAASIVLDNAITPTGLSFDTCGLTLGNTSASSTIRLGTAAAATKDDDYVEWVNCTATFGAVGQSLLPRCRFRWRGGSLGGATFPTSLFITTTGGVVVDAEIIGVDLSALDAGKNLVSGATASSGTLSFFACKLAAGVTTLTGVLVGPGGIEVHLVCCDSGDTNYREEHYTYQGSVITETALVLTGGASDGTTTFSHKAVTLASGPTLFSPLKGPPIYFWNTAIGSAHTATVNILHDSATNLTDAEVWLELDYLGTSGFPTASCGSDRVAGALTAAADQAASTATWTTTGMANPNKQKCVVTFTAQEVGLLRARLCVAKANYTLYYDPRVVTA